VHLIQQAEDFFNQGISQKCVSHHLPGGLAGSDGPRAHVKSELQRTTDIRLVQAHPQVFALMSTLARVKLGFPGRLVLGITPIPAAFPEGIQSPGQAKLLLSPAWWIRATKAHPGPRWGPHPGTFKAQSPLRGTLGPGILPRTRALQTHEQEAPAEALAASVGRRSLSLTQFHFCVFLCSIQQIFTEPSLLHSRRSPSESPSPAVLR
jgi:hypothetical protein